MATQIELRRQSDHQDNTKEVVTVRPNCSLQFDSQRTGRTLGALGVRTNFALLPSTSVAAGTDPFFTESGTGTEVVTAAAKGGVNFKSQASTPADDDNILVAAVANTPYKVAIRATAGTRLRTVLSVNTITKLFLTFGWNENLTDADPTGTAGEGAMFAFDPTGEFFNIAGGEATDGSAYWLLAHKVNGTDTFTETEVPVQAGVDYELEIVIGSDLKASFYIDGVLVGTGPALTSGDTVGAFLGFELTATPAGQKDVDVRFIEVDRDAA